MGAGKAVHPAGEMCFEAIYLRGLMTKYNRGSARIGYLARSLSCDIHAGHNFTYEGQEQA